MKTLFFFPALVVIFLSSQRTCSAQPPQWVTDLISGTLTLSVSQITHWEEKQMTWYHINGQADNADSVRVNTLYFEGITTSSQKFIGAIPVINHELNPLGARAVKGQTCTGQCGCQCCKFRKDDVGCLCDSEGEGGECCKVQEACTSCWCQHTLTAGTGN